MQPPRNRNDDFIFSHAGNALLLPRSRRWRDGIIAGKFLATFWPDAVFFA
jgi:hypothetical protein